MSTPMPNTPIPPSLLHAISSLAAGESSRESHNHLQEITRCCARDDYTWGFRIYRTCYSHTCSDPDFERAVEILHEYMRFECFVGFDEDVREAGGSDGAERELWGRLRNDVVQDREVLEGVDMVTIQQMAKEWIAERGAEISESPRYRFFLVIDEEVLRQLLKFPVPIPDYPDDWQAYSVKVLDVEYDAETDKASWRTGGPGHEGWFWAVAWRLAVLAFVDYIRDGREVCSVGGDGRALHGMTGIEMA